MRRIVRLALSVGALAVLAGACGGERAATGGDRDLLDATPAEVVVLDMRDISFDRTELQMPVGEVVAITLHNSGSLVHDLTLESPETRFAFRVLEGEPIRQEAPSRSSAHVTVRAGGTTELRVEVGEPGSYEYYCAVPGHRAAGMRGTLVVQP